MSDPVDNKAEVRAAYFTSVAADGRGGASGVCRPTAVFSPSLHRSQLEEGCKPACAKALSAYQARPRARNLQLLADLPHTGVHGAN
jgi:hypothetical protein